MQSNKKSVSPATSTLSNGEIIYNLPAGVPERNLADGTFLFLAYGCAITERQTKSGVYVYTATNIENSKNQILSRRKKRLVNTTIAHKTMAAKVRALPISGIGIHTADRNPDETSVNYDSIVGTTKHIFTTVLPDYGYAVRENQIGLAEHIVDVISQRGITLAESEVGTGKTHSYLIAAILAKRGRLNDSWLRSHYKNQSYAESAHMPIVISTSSIALQNAIVADYIPKLSQILIEHDIIRTPLSAVIRKGKEHYICEKRLLSYFSAADAITRGLLEPFMMFSFTGEHGGIKPTVKIADTNASFDLTGADALTPYMKKRICVIDCCDDTCKYFKSCRYVSYIKRANDSKIDFQITNHNYFLADTLHRVGGKRPLLPNYQLVIVDEAHKFLQAARQMYGLELTDKELPALAQEIHSIVAGMSAKGVNNHRLAKKLQEQGEKLFRCLIYSAEHIGPDDEVDRLPASLNGTYPKNEQNSVVLRNGMTASNYLINIAGISADLAASLNDTAVSKRHEERKSKVLWQLGCISDKAASLRKHTELIHWLEKSNEGGATAHALCAIPKDLDARLLSDLWNNGIPTILTSGTLSAAGDFTRIKQTLGLDRIPQHKLFDITMPSPFDYRNNTLLYISEDVPFPDNKDKHYINSVADEVQRLVTASHGHAAVLFTSYNTMGQVHAILASRSLPYPLLRLERGGVHAIERFKQSDNGILFASGSLWEGIDIPGDVLSMLIIVRLPFAFPDPIGDYERELCGDMETYKTRAIIPDMLVKLKQGHGRLIRSESDTGVVAILDSRANYWGAYRRRVLAALPECDVTSDMAAVEKFIYDRKPSAYFSGSEHSS